MVRQQNALVQEECPSCNAPITLGRRSISKKIRCPQCRLVVVVPPNDAPEAPAPVPVTPAEQAAILSPAEHSQEFWVEPIDHGAGFLGERQKGALLRHLNGGGRITITAAANDPDALLFRIQ